MKKAWPPVFFPVRLADVLGSLRPRGARMPGLHLDSGRAALQLALRCLKESAPRGRTQVVLPSFICSSVPRAVEGAGLQPVFCRLDPRTWFHDPKSLGAALGDSTAALIVVHYFGLPPEISATDATLLRQHLAGVPVVEDRAQAFGLPDEPLAPFGSAFLVYSFGPGKSLPLSHGGLVHALTAEGQARLAARAHASAEGPLAGLANLATTLLQGVVLRPAVWRFVWKPASRQHFRPRTPADREPRELAALAVNYTEQSRPTLARAIEARRANALALRARLAELPALTVPSEAVLRRGVCLRLPVVFERPSQARSVLDELARAGILVGAGDWNDYAGGRPDGVHLAERLATLPTYGGSEVIHPLLVATLARACERPAR